MWVCVCVCVCARARVRACVMKETNSMLQSHNLLCNTFSNSREGYRTKAEFRQLLRPIASNPAPEQDNILWESVNCHISLVSSAMHTKESHRYKDFQFYQTWIVRRIQPSTPLQRLIASLKVDESRKKMSSSCIIRRICHNVVRQS